MAAGSDDVQLRTPVALLIFNRPHTTRVVLESIATARPKTLLVVADGPRADRPEEVGLCSETRRLVENLSWPCDVITRYSDTNSGCDENIVGGLEWVFSVVDEAIILEDDCVPDPTFFPFCQELLTRYRDEPRVAMVRGFNVAPAPARPDSYHFSRLMHTWGWATWARGWQLYDREMRRWPELRAAGWLEGILPTRRAARQVTRHFDERYVGQHSWDYQWGFSAMAHGGLAAVPNRNLVRNIGFGPGATHLDDSGDRMAKIASTSRPIAFPLRHPGEIAPSEKDDRRELRVVVPGLATRVETRFTRGLRSLAGRAPLRPG